MLKSSINFLKSALVKGVHILGTEGVLKCALRCNKIYLRNKIIFLLCLKQFQEKMVHISIAAYLYNLKVSNKNNNYKKKRKRDIYLDITFLH